MKKVPRYGTGNFIVENTVNNYGSYKNIATIFSSRG
jgi:hypothetical protein